MSKSPSPEYLESWLLDRPVDWSLVIALRAALRAFPLIGAVHDDSSITPKQRQALQFSAIRAITMAWCAARCSAKDKKLSRAAARSAIDSTSWAALALSEWSTVKLSNKPAPISPAWHAWHSAACAARSAVDASLDTFAWTASWSAETALTTTVDHTAKMAVKRDIDFLESQRSEIAASKLASLPAWLGEGSHQSSATPIWASSAIEKFSHSLMREGHHWSIWVAWYNYAVSGQNVWHSNDSQQEAIIHRLVSAKEGFWDREPKEVNTEFATWIAEILNDLPNTFAQNGESEFVALQGKLSATTRPANAAPKDDNEAEKNQRLRAIRIEAEELAIEFESQSANFPAEVAVPLRKYIEELNGRCEWFVLSNRAKEFKGLLDDFHYVEWGGALTRSPNRFLEQHFELEPFIRPTRSKKQNVDPIPPINISGVKNSEIRIEIAHAKQALASVEAADVLDEPSLDIFRDHIEKAEKAHDAIQSEPNLETNRAAFEKSIRRLTSYTADFVTSVGKDVITKALTSPDAAATLASRLEPLLEVLLKLFGA